MVSDRTIWKIIQEHYKGQINPPSLLAQKMFDVAIEVRNRQEYVDDKFYSDKIRHLEDRIEVLENEVRVLKGLEPVWTATA